MLIIKNLNVSTKKHRIINQISLKINSGEVHAIMGPNGSGKSTLCNILVGKKLNYKITVEKMKFQNHNLCQLNPEERAALGIFLAFQHPVEIPGVNNLIFLYTAKNEIRKYKGKKKLSYPDFLNFIRIKIQELNIPQKLIHRSLNVNFSGGEKKLNEILQMLVLNPNLCILDEIDSGLDIDSLKTISKCLNAFKNQHRSYIIITHHKNIFNYIHPDFVHILYEGSIVYSGKLEIVNKIEKYGYGWLSKK